MSKITQYYSFDKILSYNATYMLCIGARGLGKTYGAKVKAVRAAIRTTKFVETYIEVERRGKLTNQLSITVEHGDQFIYLRRYKDELKLARDTFFSDFAHLFPKFDMRVQNGKAEMSPIKYREMKSRPWAIIGYFVELSRAQHYKSVSFHNVKTILFDEFIIEKGSMQYLNDEARAFNNFYSTVDRWKDKTRVYFLANSVRIANPYFIAWKIDPNKADERGFVRLENDFIVAHFPDSEAFKSEVMETRFGQFIEGTEYAEYAVANQFTDNTDLLIEDKHYKARYMFTLETKSGTFSVWYQSILDRYYCVEKRPSDDETIITMVPERMSEDKTLMTFSDKPLSMLRTAFRHDRVRFDKPQTRNAFIEIHNR